MDYVGLLNFTILPALEQALLFFLFFFQSASFSM